MDKTLIGCCGTYCLTCRAYVGGSCKGCKVGYPSRDLSRAKCKIKVCCMGKGLETCADCIDFSGCEVIHTFHDKSGYKYRKYKEAMDFLRKNGYKKFLQSAKDWKGPYGKL